VLELADGKRLACPRMPWLPWLMERQQGLSVAVPASHVVTECSHP
jgi:hypothetical protein